MEWNRDNLTSKLGYSKAILPTTLDNLAEIWNILEKEAQISELLKKSFSIELVLKEDAINKIEEINKRFPKYKNWKSYNCKKATVKIISEEQYNKEQKRIQEEKEKEELNKQKNKQWVEDQKKNFSNWKDEQWIKNNIGEYYNFDIKFEYFWTLIGDNWRQNNWKGDISIEESIYNDIKKMPMGNIFLNRKFKRNGYSHGITDTYKQKEKEKVESCGVYGIYQDKELIYIGMTMREFEIRWREHLENIKLKRNELYFEKYMDINKEIEFEKMVDICQIQTDKIITREDVKSMELALIQVFQPKGNLEGRTMPYRYNN